MTDTQADTRTEPARPAPDETADPPVTALFHQLYAFLYNKYVGVVIILAMAFATLLGTLLQQVPDSVRLNPASYAAWLQQVRPRYGGWTDILSVLGLFQVFSSWWFRAIAVLLGLSIVACTTHRLPQLIARATRPHTHVSASLFDHARYRSRFDVAADAADARTRVAAALRSRGFRVVDDPRDPGSLYADRFRWAPFGTSVAHLGFVVILVGVLISSLFGFREPGLPVTVGQKVAVGHDTGLTVEATAFSDTYYDDGRPKDYTSDLVLYRGDQRVAAQTIRVNEPLRHDGLSFHQAYFGSSAVLTIRDAAGAALFSGGIPLEYTSADGRDAYGSATLTDGRVVYAAVAASGQTASRIKPGQLLVEVYDSAAADTPTDTQLLDQGRPTATGGLTYTFEREAAYTGLLINRDPGAPWVWVGSALTVLGMCLTMLLKHRRVWARVEPSAAGATIALAAPERHDTVFERWFRALVNDLGTIDATDRKGAHHAG
nr:cytochrome c biogenesis protein ResB [Propionibacterium sp.]